MNTSIDVLSIVLPFCNEIANVLSSSDLPFFQNLYKQCIDPYLLDNYLLRTISKDKICRSRHIFSKLVIDILALFGIILNIGKNSIEYGYLTGIITGLIIVFLSFILPNLFLHKIVHGIMHRFKFKSPYMSIFIGFVVIGILMVTSVVLERLVQDSTKGVIIDTDLESATHK